MILPAIFMELELDHGRGMRFAAQASARLQRGVDTFWASGNRRNLDTVDEQAPEAIIERALAGDDEAFASLFREYDRDVLRVCRRTLGDVQAAEDAVSEVFLRARRALAGFDSSRAFRPWLLSIAGHYCIDQLRRRTSESKIFSAAEPQESDLEAPGLSPLGRMLAAEQQQSLARAIEALPPRYRLPLLLRYFEDMNYDAIAADLGVSRNQVGTLLFRAKRLLRAEVEEHGSELTLPSQPTSRSARTKRRRRSAGRKK